MNIPNEYNYYYKILTYRYVDTSILIQFWLCHVFENECKAKETNVLIFYISELLLYYTVTFNTKANCWTQEYYIDRCIATPRWMSTNRFAFNTISVGGVKYPFEAGPQNRTGRSIVICFD